MSDYTRDRLRDAEAANERLAAAIDKLNADLAAEREAVRVLAEYHHIDTQLQCTDDSTPHQQRRIIKSQYIKARNAMFANTIALAAIAEAEATTKEAST